MGLGLVLQAVAVGLLVFTAPATYPWWTALVGGVCFGLGLYHITRASWDEGVQSAAELLASLDDLVGMLDHVDDARVHAAREVAERARRPE